MGHEQNTNDFDFDSLMIMGLLHCVDRSRPVNKAKALYDVMQDGGSARHDMINARDKDWIPTCNKIFRLACIVPAMGSEQSNNYSSNELELIGEVMPTADPDNAFSTVLGWNDEVPSLLEDVFGLKSTIRFDYFVERVSKEGSWLFNTPEVRRRIFEAAGVEMKHFE